MMCYTIYINQVPLILTNTEGVKNDWKTDTKTLVANYLGKQKALYNYIDLLEKGGNYERVVIVAADVEQLWQDFQDIYKIIEAAGGVVTNAEGDTLLIYRLKTWDLPKGKIDKGETPEQAAVREIQEETGLEAVTLGDFICHTYHTYEQKGKRILKKTHWYKMQTTQKALVPQTSEDIEIAEWVNLTSFLKTKPNLYGSIFDVLMHVTN
jgi:ADP-ribose pyrophosphatase YjhB (NUDIX family)